MVYTDDQFLALGIVVMVAGVFRSIMGTVKLSKEMKESWQVYMVEWGRMVNPVLGGALMITAYAEGISADSTSYFRMAMVVLTLSAVWEIESVAGGFFRPYTSSEKITGVITSVIVLALIAGFASIAFFDPVATFPDTKMSQAEIAMLTTAAFVAALGIIEGVNAVTAYKGLDGVGIAHQSFTIIMCISMLVPVFMRIAEGSMDIIMYYLTSVISAFYLTQGFLVFFMRTGQRRGTRTHYKKPGTSNKYSDYDTEDETEEDSESESEPEMSRSSRKKKKKKRNAPAF